MATADPKNREMELAVAQRLFDLADALVEGKTHLMSLSIQRGRAAYTIASTLTVEYWEVDPVSGN